MKRLLVLAPSSPFPPQDGVKLRLHNVLTKLPGDWEIRLLAFDGVSEVREAPIPQPFHGKLVRVPLPPRPPGWIGSPLAQALRSEPSMIWRFRSPLMREQVAACARDVNAVLAVGLQMGQYLDLVPTGVPTALDNYNVESRILARLGETRTGAKRLYWLGEARKLARHEKRVLEQFGVVFAISETDREALQSLAPRARVMTLPMGIDLDVFGAPSTAEPEPQPCFTFVGAFNWHVNEDAAVWLCGQVWPRVLASLPNAQLHLVGREPSATVRALAADPTVHISGTVDDVRPYMHRSWAMLVPLRYGSGVRTKILEAFAAGRPVITTTIGCEGLPVHHGEHLHIADDAAAFANACINVAHDPSAARVLADRARQLVTRLEQEGAARIHTTLEEAFGAGLRPRRGV